MLSSLSVKGTKKSTSEKSILPKWRISAGISSFKKKQSNIADSNQDIVCGRFESCRDVYGKFGEIRQTSKKEAAL